MVSDDELRARLSEIDPLPTPHGSALFTRGETQSLTTVTLGTPLDEVLVESAAKSYDSKFFLHYNFPPFSSGEVGRVGSTNRRMIGHGALAEKALSAVIPAAADFPYTIRLVSECLASNGSTSMASVCASTLAMMDGGVPIIAPVAGMAMGLMTHNGKNKILTDIQGPEDEFGGMDFKPQEAALRAGVDVLIICTAPQL